MRNAEYYVFGLVCWRFTQILDLLNKLRILTIPHVFCDSHRLIMSSANWMYRGTAVAHFATKYYFVADIARDGAVDFIYARTDEKLADCFTKPLLKSVFFKQCTAIGIMGIGLGNGLGFCSNGHGHGIEISICNDIGIALRMLTDWALPFWGDSWCLISFFSPLFTVLSELDVIAILQKCWADWEFGYHFAKDYDVTCLFCS